MLSDNDLCCVIIAVSASRKKIKGKARKKVEDGRNSGLLTEKSSPTENYLMN
jgi:hypothetical protein